MDIRTPGRNFESAVKTANLVTGVGMRNGDVFNTGFSTERRTFSVNPRQSQSRDFSVMGTPGIAGPVQGVNTPPMDIGTRGDFGEFGDIYDRVSEGVTDMDGVKTLMDEFRGALRQQNVDLLFNFSGVLGEFSVIEFEATETINEPFEVSLRLASTDPMVDLHGLMDTAGVLGIYDRYQEARFIHGVVTDIERADTGTHRTQYRIVLRPSLWRLSQGSDSRIFQQMSVQDIVQQVLKENGVSNVEWKLAETHPKREYLTQLSENHLDFITRILSEEGIYYYFEHHVNGHKLIFCDASFSSKHLEAAETLTYNAITGGTHRREPFIKRFSQVERLRSSTYEINDYTFKNPNARMSAARQAQEENGLKSRYALYEYPGRYKDPDGVGKNFVKKRIDAVRVDATNGTGETNSVHLSPGFLFKMADHSDDRINNSHLILSVTHKGVQSAALEEEADMNASTDYTASFKTMPARLPYSPPVPKKPTIEGPQIAIVTGPEGEEIYTDEFGRVKVWFPWDRYNKKDENSSTWIRVSQAWAGSGFGGMMIPRIGQEVIVAYLDGDIDQPIIIGRTFHAVNKVPNGLPAAKTQMSLRSQTHKGEGYNELTFEDEAGKEEMRMHAQKDQNNKVGNNQSHNIGNDRTKTVGNNQSDSIGNNKATNVGNNHDENVGNNQNINIATDQNVNIGANQNVSIGSDQNLKIGSNQLVEIGSDQEFEVGASQRVKITDDQKIEVSSGNRTVKVTSGNCETSVLAGDMEIIVEAGQRKDVVNQNFDTSVKSGDLSFKVESGNMTEDIAINRATKAQAIFAEAINHIYKATGRITIQVGGEFINISEGQIDINGTAMINLKAPNIKLEGDNVNIVGGGSDFIAVGGGITIQGAPTSINPGG